MRGKQTLWVFCFCGFLRLIAFGEAATSLFNAAASDSTEEQQAVEAALRDAMSSPSRVHLVPLALPSSLHEPVSKMFFHKAVMLASMVSLTLASVRPRHFGDVFDVTDYGAKGDGYTYDTVACKKKRKQDITKTNILIFL